MKKYIWFSVLICLLNLRAWAVYDSLREKGVQISLITCGPGSEIYSVFGHTALRIIDSNAGTDIVYNYGTFDGLDDNFELNFMRGKLLYYLSEDNYNDFVSYYGMDGRWVDEQVLILSAGEKNRVRDYMAENILPENRYYKYDFFFDNCATRVRDIFTRSLGDHFVLPSVLPQGEPVSFRDIINVYLHVRPWERLGINMLLGSKIDRKMTNAEIMFLPDYLEDAISAAQLEGRNVAEAPFRLVSGAEVPHSQDYTIYILLYGLLVCLTLGMLVPGLSFLRIGVSVLVLFLSGLLGLIILLMWFATDHQTCADNFNLLWALPTNLMYLFRPRQYKYAAIAILMIFVSLLVHILGVQKLLLPEMLPLLAMLLMVFAWNYRKYKNISDAKISVSQ